MGQLKCSNFIIMCLKIGILNILSAGTPNSAKFGGVAEGQPSFDKGVGVAIIFYFLCVKNITF